MLPRHGFQSRYQVADAVAVRVADAGDLVHGAPVAGAHRYQHPALHLRELSPYGIFASFADQFEQVWQTTVSYPGGQPR